MPEPTSYEEYTKRFHAGEKISGFGLDVTVSMPCPFCAAPDWLTYRVMEVEQAIGKTTECAECGRSARALVYRSPGSVRFEIVQIGGPAQPDWLVPKMRVLPWVCCPTCGWELHDDSISGWRDNLRCMNAAAPNCNGVLIYHR